MKSLSNRARKHVDLHVIGHFENSRVCFFISIVLPTMSTHRLLQEIRFSRNFHVKQAPLGTGPISIGVNSLSNSKTLKNIEKLPNLKTPENLQLEAIGSPPSAMNIGVPPSVPVFVRRNTLLTVQGNPQLIAITSRILNPLKGLVYGGFTSRYQELIGTEPFSVMVSSLAPSLTPLLLRRTTEKSFGSITLDGASDWAILKRDALHIYGGPSLTVNLFKLPAKISRKLARRLNLSSKESTGLLRWNRAGYNFVNGRGILGLVGNGVLYTVNVAEGEELTVRKDNLVGLTVNGPYDLQNCVVKYNQSLKNDLQVKSLTVPPPRAKQVKSWGDFVMNFKYFYWKIWWGFKNLKTSYRKLVPGSQNFVRVIGPRTILFQSGPNFETFQRNFNLPSLAPESTLVVQSQSIPEKTPADYLNIVTIDPVKGATIESTENFRDPAKVGGERH